MSGNFVETLLKNTIITFAFEIMQIVKNSLKSLYPARKKSDSNYNKHGNKFRWSDEKRDKKYSKQFP